MVINWTTQAKVRQLETLYNTMASRKCDQLIVLTGTESDLKEWKRALDIVGSCPFAGEEGDQVFQVGSQFPLSLSNKKNALVFIDNKVDIDSEGLVEYLAFSQNKAVVGFMGSKAAQLWDRVHALENAVVGA